MPTTNGNTTTYSYDGQLDTFVVQTTGCTTLRHTERRVVLETNCQAVGARE